MPIWKHLRAVLLLPVMVTVVIPYLLSFIPATGMFGVENPRFELILLTRLLGFVTVYLGVLLLIRTNWLFIKHGEGTLAPWNPTQKLVVTGIYQRVRNPMITGVCLILIGETLFTVSLYQLAWTVIFIVGNAIYIPLSEEPRLEERFGQDYLEYKQNVPRWRLRRQPWEPEKAATKNTNLHEK